MRLPSLFLACLILIAAFNVALAGHRLWQIRALPPALASTRPADAFATRLDAISDPAELRRLALGRHQALLAADHTTQEMFATVGTISRSDLMQSGVVLLLALGVYFFERPARRP